MTVTYREPQVGIEPTTARRTNAIRGVGSRDFPPEEATESNAPPAGLPGNRDSKPQRNRNDGASATDWLSTPSGPPPIRHGADLYGPEIPRGPWVAIAGSETFGVPQKRPGPTRSGAATLVHLNDRRAVELLPGELLLAEDAAGLYVVHVAQVRTGIAGDLGSEYEVPVVDVRRLDGTWCGFAPSELLDVEVDP